MQVYPDSFAVYSAKTFHYPDGGVETIAWINPDPRPDCDFLPLRLKAEGGTSDESRLESRKRSVCRAKAKVRRLCRSMGVDRLLTFTSREAGQSFDEVKADWDLMRRRVLKVMPGFHYVAVVEEHPSNPGHYHLHVAVAGFKDVNVLRREWHAVLRRRIKLEGAPGNVDVGGGRSYARARKHANTAKRIAGYISKYVGKSLSGAAWVLGRKGYWHSRAAQGLLRMTRWVPAAQTWADLEVELVGDDCISGVRSFNPAPGILWLEGWVARVPS